LNTFSTHIPKRQHLFENGYPRCVRELSLQKKFVSLFERVKPDDNTFPSEERRIGYVPEFQPEQNNELVLNFFTESRRTISRKTGETIKVSCQHRNASDHNPGALEKKVWKSGKNVLLPFCKRYRSMASVSSR
jgi:hypothetical protein